MAQHDVFLFRIDSKLRKSQRFTIAVGLVVRRHDFNIRLGKIILNILMQAGTNRNPALGMFCGYDELVLHIKIIQRKLQHLRGRGFEHIRHSLSCIDQQFMNFTPGHIVANRNRRADVNAARFSEEMDDMSGTSKSSFP